MTTSWDEVTDFADERLWERFASGAGLDGAQSGVEPLARTHGVPTDGRQAIAERLQQRGYGLGYVEQRRRYLEEQPAELLVREAFIVARLQKAHELLARLRDLLGELGGISGVGVNRHDAISALQASVVGPPKVGRGGEPTRAAAPEGSA